MDNTLSWNNHIDQYSLLYNQKCQNIHVCLIIKSNLSCFLSLCYELWNYILGKLVTYLQVRCQRTLVDYDSKKYYSKWDIITDGVPQGSKLGPLLFLLYVNDIPHVISDIANPILYADVTSLIITNSDNQSLKKV